MKAIIRTSVMLVAMAGFIALLASPALAAPTPLGPDNGGPLIEMQSMPIQLQADDDVVVPPDELVNPGDDQVGQPDDGLEEDCVAVHCDSENGNPGYPGDLDTPKTPEVPTVTPPATETPQVPSSRLPNTGSQLLLLAGLGLGLTAVAIGVRRIVINRSR